MDVVVDVGSGRVSLEGWATVTSLSVQVDGGPLGGPDAEDERGLSAALSEAGIGRAADTGDALVPAAVLRGLAVEAAAQDGYELDDGWDEGFTGMLDYAGNKGWIDDDGAVRAHVEWRDT